MPVYSYLFIDKVAVTERYAPQVVVHAVNRRYD